MPAYVVLARKWRPAQFIDIVGQRHIVRTLMNAIRLERVHHAYLFTGSRGIGKTSIARIFAKVMRCENIQDQNGILKSCDHCSSCREITMGTSMDVIEIDGASNNGVESVREIRENAQYMPTLGTRKIYIIDEVHMLTTAAFNALLKILEEPPAHIIFIFATTEPHKIPATILSRCQRFDYRRVTLSQSQTRLEEIAQAEGIQTEPGALALIARASEGSMRDALSLLDQAIAFSGPKITIESVRESVGLIGGQTLIEILKAIFQRNSLAALDCVNQAYQQGHDLRTLTRSLTEFLHAVLLIQVKAPHSSAHTLSEEEWAELQAIAPLRTLEETEMIFQVLHHGLDWIARSPQPKIVLDVLIIKCATAEALIFTDELPSQGPDHPVIEQKEPSSQPPISREVSPGVAVQKPSAEQKLQPSWEGWIEHIRKSRPLLASMLEHVTHHQFPNLDNQSSDQTMHIYFSSKEAYFREQLQTRVYQEQLSQLSREYLGSSIRIQIELQDQKTAGESFAARKEREQIEKIASIRIQAQNHPIILEAKSLFGGELGPIDIHEEKHANTS